MPERLLQVRAERNRDEAGSKALVSSVIIFFNAEKFLREAIESVLTQTYNNWELLLVDDGSTDGSSEIALQYAASYPRKVRYLEHEDHQNRGMSASRNLGVSQARGEYVAFLDADDVWLPHKLEHQVAILESQPEAAMLYGRTQFWYSWTGKSKDVRRDCITDLGVKPDTLVQPPTLLVSLLRDEGIVAYNCSVLIRREVFEDVGGFEEDFRDIYEDMVFYTKVFFRKPVFVADECWGRYRQHSDKSTIVALKAGRSGHLWQPSLVREVYLNWVAKYLREQGAEGTELWKVVQREMWPYRHLILYRLSKLVKLVARQLLPARVHRHLRSLWKRRMLPSLVRFSRPSQ